MEVNTQRLGELFFLCVCVWVQTEMEISLLHFKACYWHSYPKQLTVSELKHTLQDT